MEFLLVDLLTGRVLGEYDSRDDALDEVLAEIDVDGEDTVDTLAFMWREPNVTSDSVSGKRLLAMARSRALRFRLNDQAAARP